MLKFKIMLSKDGYNGIEGDYKGQSTVEDNCDLHYLTSL